MKKTTGKKGFALTLVLSAVALGTIAVTGVVKYSSQRAHSARRLGDQSKAIAYSEAGLDWAYAQIQTNFALRTNSSAFPSANYGDGSYEISLSHVTSNSVLVTCVGYCNGVSNTAAVTIRDYSQTLEPEPEDNSELAWNFAAFSKGMVNWSGCGTFSGSGTQIYSDQPFVIKGSGYINADVFSTVEIEQQGNAEIDGNITAPSLDIQKSSKISGTQTADAVEPIAFPTLNLQPYLDHATVINGDLHIKPSTFTAPSDGILWVNGKVTISGPGTLNCCIIATDDIISSASGTISGYGTYPTFVSINGDIAISAQADYNGLLFAQTGDFAMSGSGTITGQIMVAGNMSKSGCSSAFSFVQSIPVPPDADTPDAEAKIDVAAYEQL